MHRFLLGAVAAAVAVGVALFCWDGPNRRGCGRPPRTIELLEAPGGTVDAIGARMRAKRELSRRVVTRRIPLPEAADLFREANGPSGLRDLERYTLVGDSLHEKLCRQVVHYAAASEAELEQAGRALPGPSHAAALRDELGRLRAAGALVPGPHGE